MRRPTIAIDGPAGSGKTTVARLVAQRLGLVCVETGAMYRAVAWQARTLGIPADDARALADMTGRMDLGVESAPDGRTKVLVADADISAELRTPELEQLASQVSTHAEVRRKLVELQRRIAQAGGVVMEGRDIQTVVLPDADVKVFLTASVDERACRRMKDLEAAGEHASLAEVRRQIEARDRRDETRAASPLRAAPDAVTIDTDNLSVEQVVGRIIALVQR